MLCTCIFNLYDSSFQYYIATNTLKTKCDDHLCFKIVLTKIIKANKSIKQQCTFKGIYVYSSIFIENVMKTVQNAPGWSMDDTTNMNQMSVEKKYTQKIQVKWNMKFFVSFHLYFLILHKMVIGRHKRLICVSPQWPFYANTLQNTGKMHLVGTGLRVILRVFAWSWIWQRN